MNDKIDRFCRPILSDAKNRPTFVCHTTDFIARYFGDKFSSRTCSNVAKKIGRFYRSSVIVFRNINVEV